MFQALYFKNHEPSVNFEPRIALTGNHEYRKSVSVYRRKIQKIKIRKMQQQCKIKTKITKTMHQKAKNYNNKYN